MAEAGGPMNTKPALAQASAKASFGCGGYSAGNFAAIGNKNFFEHGQSVLVLVLRPLRRSFLQKRLQAFFALITGTNISYAPGCFNS